MALLSRRKLADAAKVTQAPQTEPQGASGRYNTGGFLDFDEINAKLTGKLGLRAFDMMWRTDADVRKALTMIVSTMVAGSWDVEAPGNEDEPTTDDEQSATDLVRYALFEAMRPKLPSHLWTALTVAGRFGFAPFEQVWKLVAWQGRDVWVPATLDLRLPRSVDRFLDDGGELAGIEQFAPGTRDGVAISRTSIPASDLVYYRFGAEGNNWEGQSLLRPAYKHWKYKDAIERMQAMGIERSALGVPTGYVPQDASPEQRDDFEAFLANVRASDATYFMAPGPAAQYADKGQGWHWEFVTPNSTRGDSIAIPETLKYHSDKIAASVLEEFMRQGMGEVGTNSTADTQQDPFLKLCEALVSIVVEDTINEQLIPRLVDLNFSVDRYPELSCSLIDATTLTELASYIKTLADAGAIRPEPRLEAFLRDRADLPEADEAAIAEAQQQEAEQAQAEADRAHAQALELTAAKGTPAPGGKQMSLGDTRLLFNPNHVPDGPDGGQFTSGAGGLKALVEKFASAGVRIEAHERDHGIHLSLIHVGEENRGQGKANAAMRALLHYADGKGKVIGLTPDPVGKGGLSKAALTRWYRGFGFVPNKGRNAHYEISESMIREPKRQADAATRTLARQSRDLKPHEQHMRLDRIEASIDGARARFEDAAGPHALELARVLANEARAGNRIAADDPPAPLVDALATELTSLYLTGRATVRDELASQAASVTPAFTLAAFDRTDPGPSAIERLRARALAAADAVRAAIVQALHRTALHRGTGPADLQMAAEQAARGALRTAAQDHAAAALNAGRVDQADEDADMIAGAYYTSILDGNRCPDCARADDDVLRPLDDPVRLAHVPPNPECNGGARCRCMEAYRFKSEAAAAV